METISMPSTFIDRKRCEVKALKVSKTTLREDGANRLAGADRAGYGFYPKNSSRSSLELIIFFKVKLLAAIDDFTIWARCGVVENR